MTMPAVDVHVERVDIQDDIPRDGVRVVFQVFVPSRARHETRAMQELLSALPREHGLRLTLPSRSDRFLGMRAPIINVPTMMKSQAAPTEMKRLQNPYEGVKEHGSW